MGVCRGCWQTTWNRRQGVAGMQVGGICFCTISFLFVRGRGTDGWSLGSFFSSGLCAVGFFSWFSLYDTADNAATQELDATRSSCMSFCISVPPISSSIPPSFDARGRRRRHDTTWGGGLTRPAPDLSSSNELVQRMTPPRCTYRLGASTMAETAARHVYTISPCSQLGRRMESATLAGYPTALLAQLSSPPPGTVHVSG